MISVYYAIPNENPVFIADFDAEEFAQVLVDAGNKLYAGEREFYLEDSAADEAEEEVEEEAESDSYCTNCAGTGEGQHDGARCWVCKGSGETKLTLKEI